MFQHNALSSYALTCALLKHGSVLPRAQLLRRRVRAAPGRRGGLGGSGLAHVKNREQNAIKPVVTCDPPFLGTPLSSL